jgi:hypothetical protein
VIVLSYVPSAQESVAACGVRDQRKHVGEHRWESCRDLWFELGTDDAIVTCSNVPAD